MSKQVFAVILGQCSEGVRDRITAHHTFQAIQSQCNVISLLELIRSSLYSGATTRNLCQSSQETIEKLFSFKQGSRMTNSRYLEKFKELTEMVTYFGIAIGQEPQQVSGYLRRIAVDRDNPTDEEKTQASIHARDEYIAILFLRHSDPRRYGSLLADLENSYTRGIDEYPKTLSRAYDYLVNYKSPNKAYASDPNEGGLSYLTQTPGSTDTGQPRGGRPGRGAGQGPATGRGGRSPGRGSHPNSGRGNGGAFQPQETHLLLTNEDDDSDQVDVNLDQTTGSYYPVLSVPTAFFQEVDLFSNTFIILDSASSVNICSNGNLLMDIHQVNKRLAVKTVGNETVYLNKMGYLGSYPEPVWYHPKGSANIMSLNNVSSYYRITMDTSVLNGFYLHSPDGSKVLFTPTGNGLYAHTQGKLLSIPPQRYVTAETFYDTVEENKMKYPK